MQTAITLFIIVQTIFNFQALMCIIKLSDNVKELSKEKLGVPDGYKFMAETFTFGNGFSLTKGSDKIPIDQMTFLTVRSKRKDE
jgi:hypothetical protein